MSLDRAHAPAPDQCSFKFYSRKFVIFFFFKNAVEIKNLFRFHPDDLYVLKDGLKRIANGMSIQFAPT